MIDAALFPDLTKPERAPDRCRPRSRSGSRPDSRSGSASGSRATSQGDSRRAPARVASSTELAVLADAPGPSIAERVREVGGTRVLVTSSPLRPWEIAELASMRATDPVEVRFRIATPDARLAALLEPGASAPRLRLASLRAARRAGIVAGVVVAPLIPGITVHEGDLVHLFSEARACGASFVGAEVRFLDPVRASAMLDTLRRHYPRVAARYEVWLRTQRAEAGEERGRVDAFVERLARRFRLDAHGAGDFHSGSFTRNRASASAGDAGSDDRAPGAQRRFAFAVECSLSASRVNPSRSAG